MSRVAISLDPHALAELRRRAATNKEPVARTAARLVSDGLLSTHVTPVEAAQTLGQEPQELIQPLPWIEPATKPQQWRRQLWATVVALHKRYPRALCRLPADWWTDRALIETLAALSQWRTQLDTGQQPDPRSELLFHDRLAVIERELVHTADPVAARFTGGPPPSDWALGSRSLD